jgi:hypothetical protein
MNLGCRLAFATLALFAASKGAQGQILFNDNFNSSSVTTNTGTGDVNPSSSTTVFSTAATPSQNSNGANFTPPSSYSHQSIYSSTGNTDGNTAYALTGVPTTFSITVNTVTVTSDSTANARPDIPESGNAGFTWEFGLFSANNTSNDPELYSNTTGGIYLRLFYDKEGVLSGNLRAVDSTHASGADASGTTGIHELASFTIAQPGGTTTSYTTPLTVSFALTSTGYSVGLSQAATVVSGSLSGSFTALEQTNLSPGVRMDLFGQGWNNGDGSGTLSNVAVTAPEPPAAWLLGAGLLALGAVSLRRAHLA